MESDLPDEILSKYLREQSGVLDAEIARSQAINDLLDTEVNDQLDAELQDLQ